MTTESSKAQLTAPCGLDCFNCDLYEKNVSESLINIIATRQKRDPKTIPCKGCRPNGGDCLFVGKCPTYQCAKEKGVQLCFECKEFPCLKLAPAKEGADRFPHNFKLFNLCRIKAVGVERWAENESQEIRRLYFKGKFIPGVGPVSEKAIPKR